MSRSEISRGRKASPAAEKEHADMPEEQLPDPIQAKILAELEILAERLGIQNGRVDGLEHWRDEHMFHAKRRDEQLQEALDRVASVQESQMTPSLVQEVIVKALRESFPDEFRSQFEAHIERQLGKFVMKIGVLAISGTTISLIVAASNGWISFG